MATDFADYSTKAKLLKERNERLLMEGGLASSESESDEEDDDAGGAGASGRKRDSLSLSRDSDSDFISDSDSQFESGPSKKKRKTEEGSSSSMKRASGVSVIDVLSSDDDEKSSDAELEDVELDYMQRLELERLEADRMNKNARRLREQRQYCIDAGPSSFHGEDATQSGAGDISIDEEEAAKLAAQIAKERMELKKTDLDRAEEYTPDDYKEKAKEHIRKTLEGGNAKREVAQDRGVAASASASGVNCANFTVTTKNNQEKTFSLGMEDSFEMLRDLVAVWLGLSAAESAQIKFFDKEEQGFVSLQDCVEDYADPNDSLTFELRGHA